MVATRRSASGNQSQSTKSNDKSQTTKPETGAKRTKDEADNAAENAEAADSKEDESSKKAKTENGAAEQEAATKDEKVLDEQKDELESHDDALAWLHSNDAWKLANPPAPSASENAETDRAQAGEETARPQPASYTNKRPNASAGGPLSFPNSDLSPFQTLMCAVLLSKPISHRLGMRTIDTLLNKPYYFRTVQDLLEADNEGRRAALWEARTQHKEKTAEQLGNLAQGLVSLCGEKQADSLTSVLDQALENTSDKSDSFAVAEQIKTSLTKEINGLGPGGVDIFLRRIQAQWHQVFPFADKRTLETAVQFKLIDSKDLDQGVQNATKKLAAKIAEHVGFPLDKANKSDDEEAECGRWWLVRTLDVLIGLDVEKKVPEALKLAGVKQ